VGKPVLLIRSDGNDVDEVALTKLGIASLVDPYIAIKVASDPSQGERLFSVMENSDHPIWLLATSVNALKFWSRIVGADRLRAAIAKHDDMKFAAIGEATADALRGLGAKEVLLSKGATASSLASALIEAPPIGYALIPGGNLAMKSLPSALLSAGWQVSTAIVYTTSPVETEPKSARLIRNQEVSAILFRSPSAVPHPFCSKPRSSIGLCRCHDCPSP
jgi:uroporphyrinogen-III synthase